MRNRLSHILRYLSNRELKGRWAPAFFLLLLFVGQHSTAYGREECHIGFSEKAAAEQAQAKVLREIDAKKYRVLVEKFEGVKITWYLSAQPVDPAVQRKIDDISQALGAARSCGYPLPEIVEKPVIYLYPLRPLDVWVQLDLPAQNLAVTYPSYDESIQGWRVTAFPNGKLVNQADGEEYSYLFWEAKGLGIDFDLSTGFVVPGSQTKDFLRSILKEMGLTPEEYNEFIVYWLPRMQGNAYNLIHFAGEEYVRAAPLKITPKPDSMLRVFMVFRPLSEPISIPRQKIAPFRRTGFSVVEWGGTELQP